ncbi:Nitrogen regulatory protein P-II [Corynebacterium kalinowskii]|uniref:Nitrogen regulatory protein P-II n=1 Tax=Corynebacterium kalinowskii TaxID=2675216 RepID=A0A6B8VYB5_9CORY|nr:P-II family nitrogen regulator [Corynebacterium kalinowskii]QGU02310.1 Nitrogen regulatory protein P-II [Corynebacterium kalinowskii]
MKLVSAVIQPFMLDEVRDALRKLGCHGMTVTDVQGFGMQKAQQEVYRGANYNPEYVAKSKIEILIHEQFQEQVVSAIVEAARTGNVGDGKIWVTNVEEAVRVRTGERGDAAL